MSASREAFELEVNGAPARVEGDGGAPLLYALRNALGLKGVRFGCGDGACGACTVLIDDVDRHACQVTLGEAAGRRITTVEGLLDPDGAPGAVQQALIDRRAGQCGYCLSGIVMRLEALLRSGEADRARIVGRLSENLCRCGAHVRILRAVDDLLQMRRAQ